MSLLSGSATLRTISRRSKEHVLDFGHSIRMTLSPASTVENDPPAGSGKKLPTFSLKILKVTHAAAVMAVSPTPKGKKTLRASAVDKLPSAVEAILELWP